MFRVARSLNFLSAPGVVECWQHPFLNKACDSANFAEFVEEIASMQEEDYDSTGLEEELEVGYFFLVVLSLPLLCGTPFPLLSAKQTPWCSAEPSSSGCNG